MKTKLKPIILWGNPDNGDAWWPKDKAYTSDKPYLCIPLALPVRKGILDVMAASMLRHSKPQKQASAAILALKRLAKLK